MTLNPIPLNIPNSIRNDPEIGPYFEEFSRAVYEMWFALNGNKDAILISTTEIDATQTGNTELLKVDPNKTFIPLYVVIRVTEFTAGSKSTQAVASFGGNGTYDDFLNSITYTVTGADTYQIDKPSTTELPVQDETFRVIIETASNATVEKWNIDLFGYLT